MKAKINVLINVPDDFKCGECNNCPIHQESYSSMNYGALKVYCPLGFNSISCPIEISKAESEE